MRIADILKDKGAEVTTVSPDSPVSEAISVLASRRIGAIPVSEDGRTLLGIVSERDVVRALAQQGADGFGSMNEEAAMTRERNAQGGGTTGDRSGADDAPSAAAPHGSTTSSTGDRS